MTEATLVPGYVPPVVEYQTAEWALASAIYAVSQAHDWEHTIDRGDRTAEIIAALPDGWALVYDHSKVR